MAADGNIVKVRQAIGENERAVSTMADARVEIRVECPNFSASDHHSSGRTRFVTDIELQPHFDTTLGEIQAAERTVHATDTELVIREQRAVRQVDGGESGAISDLQHGAVTQKRGAVHEGRGGSGHRHLAAQRGIDSQLGVMNLQRAAGGHRQSARHLQRSGEIREHERVLAVLKRAEDEIAHGEIRRGRGCVRSNRLGIEIGDRNDVLANGRRGAERPVGRRVP
jgi:hypothetical protein